jgi:hypothetical protein
VSNVSEPSNVVGNSFIEVLFNQYNMRQLQFNFTGKEYSWSFCSNSDQLLIELGVTEINHVNAALEIDKGNSLSLKISLELTSPHCIIN